VSGVVTDKLGFTLDWFCDTATPGAPPVTPCPPDDVARQLLQQIYALLQIVQRQAAPFAYVYGANHTGLTDTNEIAVADLLGVSVQPTTIPTSYGREAGTPETLFDLGFVSLGTTDGWVHSRRIDHDGTLFLPDQAGVFTRLGYTLAPGVVADIRELVREP
jgi:hypothetical protein